MAIVNEVKFYNPILDEEVTFNRDSKQFNLEVLDLGYVDSNMKTQDLYNKDGVSVSNVKYGTRTITMVAWLIGYDDRAISVLRRRINRFFNPKHLIEIYQNGYLIRGYPLHTPMYGNTLLEINDKMCQVLIEFYCNEPLFTTEESKTVIIASWDPQFIFPLEFPYPNETMIFGLRRPSFIVEIDQEGDEPCGMMITFIANGVVSLPRITNIETQEFIELNITLQQGQRAVVNTAGMITKATLFYPDETTENILNAITDVSSQAMKLPIGKSSFTYSAGSHVENLSLLIGYDPLFLEVL